MNPSHDTVSDGSVRCNVANRSETTTRRPIDGGEQPVVTPPCETIFAGSNGRYYTDWQVRDRLRSGEWALCLRQRRPNRRLVETADDVLLLLTPVEPTALPAGLEVRVTSRRARVVDTRHVPWQSSADR